MTSRDNDFGQEIIHDYQEDDNQAALGISESQDSIHYDKHEEPGSGNKHERLEDTSDAVTLRGTESSEPQPDSAFPFDRFPKEIGLMIWEHALPEPRLVQLSVTRIYQFYGPFDEVDLGELPYRKYVEMIDEEGDSEPTDGDRDLTRFRGNASKISANDEIANKGLPQLEAILLYCQLGSQRHYF